MAGGNNMQPMGAAPYAISGLNTISETPTAKTTLVFNNICLLAALFTALIIPKKGF